MPLILYVYPASPAVRSVLITAEALGLKLELKEVDLFKGEQLKPEFLKLNPQHTVPVLDDNGTIVNDSHAILPYLVRKYGKNDDFYPKDYAKRALVDHRLHFDTGKVFNILFVIAVKIYFKGAKSVSEEDRNAALEVYKYLEIFLSNGKWVAGDQVTIADFSLLASVTSLNILVKIQEKDFPNITRWLKQAEQVSYFNANKPGLEAHRKMLTALLSA